MSQIELFKRILDKLEKQIACGGCAKFNGLSKRKMLEGEVILKCPITDISKCGDLKPLASDLTRIFVNYIEEEGLKQIKAIIKNILSSE